MNLLRNAELNTIDLLRNAELNTIDFERVENLMFCSMEVYTP